MEDNVKDIKKDEQPESEKDKKQPKKWEKVAGWILTALLVLALIFAVILVVQVKSSKMPFIFGYATFYVVSGSMEPTIHVGEVILIERVSGPDDLKKGDIITFHGKRGKLEGKIVTHRIVSDGVVDGEITTCGDANYGIADDPIEYDAVIGRYVRTSAALTTAYAVFTSKYGFLFIVFIPLIILLHDINVRRACRMDKDGKIPEEKSAEELKEQAVKEKEAEIKRKAVEEYLASKKRIEEAERNKNKK